MSDLYAITPSYSPDPVDMYVFGSDEEALDMAIFHAAKDLIGGVGSPTADVWKVTAGGLVNVGRAKAANAPADWPWAHPAVEEKLAEDLEWHKSGGADADFLAVFVADQR